MKLKNVFLVLAIAWTASAWAKVKLPKGPTNILCPTASITELDALGATGKWFRQADFEPGGWTFRSPTKALGQWVELRLSAKGVSEIFAIQLGTSTVIKFDKNCFKKTAQDNLFPAALGDSKFTDTDLKTLLASGKPGLIYVWSPDMVYSMKHYHQFESLCKALKIDFVPMVDTRGNFASIAEAAKNYGMPANPKIMNSVEIFMRGLNHHPTSYVYNAGKLSFDPILGVKTDEVLRKDIVIGLAHAERGE